MSAYRRNAERTEEFKVKMVTSDDEQTTDIVVEGGCEAAGSWGVDGALR